MGSRVFNWFLAPLEKHRLSLSLVFTLPILANCCLCWRGSTTYALHLRSCRIVALSLKSGGNLLNTNVALKSRHSLLRCWMHRGSLLLTCVLYVALPQAYTTLLHACSLSFPEFSCIFILFPGTNYHTCIVITHEAWVSMGLPWGPRWSLVIPGGTSEASFPWILSLSSHIWSSVDSQRSLWIPPDLGVCWFICTSLECACYILVWGLW